MIVILHILLAKEMMKKKKNTRRRGHCFDYEEKGRNEKHGAELKYVKLVFPTFLKRMVTSL